MFLQFSFSVLVTLAAGHPGQLESDAKSGRLLRIFSVVKFPNDACNTTLGDYGVCYTVTKYKQKIYETRTLLYAMF